MTGEPKKQESMVDDRSSPPALAEPLTKERLYAILAYSRKFSREAATIGRSLGMLSDSDLRIRLR